MDITPIALLYRTIVQFIMWLEHLYCTFHLIHQILCLLRTIFKSKIKHEGPRSEQTGIDLWQSRIEIQYYSITYFERITEFDAL